jgi:O-antigen ligase
MLLGLFFVWNLLSLHQVENRKERWKETALSVAFLWMIWWLFSLADSATSLACLEVGAATMALVGMRFVSKRFIGSYVLVGLLMIVAAQMSFGIYDKAVDLLGRNTTLTDRTTVWQDVLEMDRSPVFGAGFESFWLGPRLEAMWARWWWHPIQAHNGYIETYLNLGWVGVTILAALIIATFRKARRELLRDLDFGRFRLGVLFAIILYNCTEATFTGVHLVWTFFYLIAIDYPAVQPVTSDIHLAELRLGAPEVDPGVRMGVVARMRRRTSLGHLAASDLPRPLRSRTCR